jgi:hypothetical protein
LISTQASPTVNEATNNNENVTEYTHTEEPICYYMTTSVLLEVIWQ